MTGPPLIRYRWGMDENHFKAQIERRVKWSKETGEDVVLQPWAAEWVVEIMRRAPRPKQGRTPKPPYTVMDARNRYLKLKADRKKIANKKPADPIALARIKNEMTETCINLAIDCGYRGEDPKDPKEKPKDRQYKYGYDLISRKKPRKTTSEE